MSGLFTRVRRSLGSRLQTSRWKAHEARKRRQLNKHSGAPKGPIFIFGCQRSGTTHVERLFRADPRSSVFGEFSPLSITPEHTAWSGHAAMRETLAHHPGAYWVIRSLFASHEAREILEAWPAGVAFWIFRDPNSVVDSMIRKWRGDFRLISERVETDVDGQWALRELWDQIEFEAKELCNENEAEALWRDTYALYWAARNRLVFDLDLASHPRFLFADYANFTHGPEDWLQALRKRIGVSEPSTSFPIETRSARRAERQKPQFSPAIQNKCDALYEEMKATTSRLYS